MSSGNLIEHLNNLGPATKENRDRIAIIVLNHPNLIKELIEITFWVDDKISIKAAWILEWITTHYGIYRLYPYLTHFSKNISELTFESAIRPCAKISEHLAIEYDKTKEKDIDPFINELIINALVETGFDWLITPQKTAVRAYTMNMLFLFGKEIPWIHDELKHLITAKILYESKGTLARGRHILQAIEKHQRSTR